MLPSKRSLLAVVATLLAVCLAEGLTTDEIARRSGITSDGVKKHFTVIFHKLGASRQRG